MSDKKIIAVVGATGAQGGGLLCAIPANRRGNVGHRVAGPSALRDVNPLVQFMFEDFGAGELPAARRPARPTVFERPRCSHDHAISATLSPQAAVICRKYA
jgi:hypothetical protein